MARPIAPPWAPRHHDAEVEPAQAAVRRPHPPPRPPDPSLPLAGAPEQDGGDRAAHQGHFFHRLDHPVDASAEAEAVFARAQEEEVGEGEGVEGEEEDEEGVQVASGEEL